MAYAKSVPKGNSLVQEDAALVYEAYRLSNGATVHRLNNMVGAYKGYLELAREGTEGFLEHVERMERELRVFIAKERALTIGQMSIY